MQHMAGNLTGRTATGNAPGLPAARAGREADKKAWSEYAQALLASNETQFVD